KGTHFPSEDRKGQFEGTNQFSQVRARKRRGLATRREEAEGVKDSFGRGGAGTTGSGGRRQNVALSCRLARRRDRAQTHRATLNPFAKGRLREPPNHDELDRSPMLDGEGAGGEAAGSPVTRRNASRG